jgi:hypothetical protein
MRVMTRVESLFGVRQGSPRHNGEALKKVGSSDAQHTGTVMSEESGTPDLNDIWLAPEDVYRRMII